MSFYKDFILEPVKYGLAHPNKGIPIPIDKLSKYTNYITRGQSYAIGGKPNSGKSSFMDHIYMINVYKWWRDLPYEKHTENIYDEITREDGSISKVIINKEGSRKLDEKGNPIEIGGIKRPPLKMFYFSMKTRPQIKFQKWLCLYLKLYYDITIDVPTLTNGIGRLYELDDDILEKISEAQDFFEDFEKDVLTFINGRHTSTYINERVDNYMETVGRMTEHGYEYDDKHSGQITFVYIDNVDKLRAEIDGFQKGDPQTAKRNLMEYVDQWKSKYDITSFMVVPSKVTNSRMVKDSEPSYKELGLFAESVDIGLVMYNAYNENNNGYLNYPIKDLVIKGKNRFRTITIIRNNGLENICVGLIFLGECGYFRESPHPVEEHLFSAFIDSLSKLP